MNVVQVTPRYPPQTGGVESHVREISERLVERGHDVTVHTADAGMAGRRAERRNGVRIRRHRGFAPSGALHIAPGIGLAVRRSRPDVVHAHNYHSLPLLFATLGVTDARLVVTPHYHGRSASRLRNLLLGAYRPVGAGTLRRADSVVAVSDNERDRLRGEFDVDPIVVPNGVDIEKFAGVTPATRKLPYILSVGRLEEYKGIQHVLSALDHLPEHEFLIVGTGSFEANLRKTARERGVADRVEFLGYVSDDELPGLYGGADVCVTLSAFEAYGMSVAESLATGTPCVVRAGSGLDDWAANPGVVRIDSTDPDVVAQAIRRARNRQPDRTNIHDWDDIVDQIESVYLAHE